ncbi:rRNA methyltransferase 2, mitochondrial-like [Littorina saxatilis]|uniref:rRNA methyltransferase 2, mitochondrial n=1 Tax=Littorina saxatilis TaxID=31220 RepID=A0AAN9GMC5_9CAEN
MAASRGILMLRDMKVAFPYQFSSGGRWYSSKSPSLKGKSTSSQNWIKRQLSDPYVKKARTENYRCRSAFKLLEMDEKHRLLQPGSVVIDCGAAPGSWTQVAVDKVCSANQEHEASKAKGLVIGIDLEHMVPVEGAYILHQSDFTSQNTQQKILNILSGRQVDVVLSDMAPRATGQKALDHEQIINLCFTVLIFGRNVLRPGGHLVCKLWQGSDQPKLEHAMSTMFKKVKVAKPDSSRSESAEVFLVGKNFLEQKK